MKVTGWVVVAVVNIPVYLVLAKIIFRNLEGFADAIRFWLTPDLFSAARGEYFEDRWAEMKLGVWLLLCVAVVVSEGLLIQRHFLQ